MENKLNLLQRLNKFRQIVGAVKKDGTNPHYRSKYATIESVLETIDKPLNDCGLGYYQIVANEDLRTIIFNVDNVEEKLESSIRLLLASPDMQKLGSAITYARRYGLVSMFGLEQEDDDGNSTKQEYKLEEPKQKIQTIQTNEEECCPECGSKLILKNGKYGKFWSCTGYPKCQHKQKKYIEPKAKTEEEIENEELNQEIPF